MRKGTIINTKNILYDKKPCLMVVEAGELPYNPRPLKEAPHGTRSLCTLAHSVCCEHHFSHPVSDHYDRFGLVFAVLPGSFHPNPGYVLGARLQLLGQSLRADLRIGRGIGHYHEFPVRHQLAGLYGTDG